MHRHGPTTYTSLHWRATHLTAVMNKTKATWSCVYIEVLLMYCLSNSSGWLFSWQYGSFWP